MVSKNMRGWKWMAMTPQDRDHRDVSLKRWTSKHLNLIVVLVLGTRTAIHISHVQGFFSSDLLCLLFP